MNRLEDEMALRNLMARYVDAANRRDGEAWKATWEENGTWCLMGQNIHGREQIHATWSRFMTAFDFALLLPSCSEFSVQGDRASGYWYLQEFTRTTAGECTQIVGHYRDHYLRSEDGWRYLQREYTPLYSGPPDLGGRYSPLSQSA